MEVNGFGYELIREEVITQILGKDSPEILYCIGKQIARKYPLSSIEEVVEYFDSASWGTLEVLKEKKTELQFQLTSPIITERLNKNSEAHFQLESGFLAQQIELIKEFVTESYEEPKKKNGIVTFRVKWDDKDVVKKD